MRKYTRLRRACACVTVLVYVPGSRVFTSGSRDCVSQVIDIVRTNVRAVLLRVWNVSDVETLRLHRVFSRVFNRLLWSHGQGLWNCFQSSGYHCHCTEPLCVCCGGGVSKVCVDLGLCSGRACGTVFKSSRFWVFADCLTVFDVSVPAKYFHRFEGTNASCIFPFTCGVETLT